MSFRSPVFNSRGLRAQIVLAVAAVVAIAAAHVAVQTGVVSFGLGRSGDSTHTGPQTPAPNAATDSETGSAQGAAAQPHLLIRREAESPR